MESNPTIAMSVKDILRSPDNKRGEKFDPTWRYIMVTPTMVSRKLDLGFKVLVGEVEGSAGEKFVLMGRGPNG